MDQTHPCVLFFWYTDTLTVSYTCDDRKPPVEYIELFTCIFIFFLTHLTVADIAPPEDISELPKGVSRINRSEMNGDCADTKFSNFSGVPRVHDSSRFQMIPVEYIGFFTLYPSSSHIYKLSSLMLLTLIVVFCVCMYISDRIRSNIS